MSYDCNVPNCSGSSQKSMSLQQAERALNDTCASRMSWMRCYFFTKTRFRMTVLVFINVVLFSCHSTILSASYAPLFYMIIRMTNNTLIIYILLKNYRIIIYFLVFSYAKQSETVAETFKLCYNIREFIVIVHINIFV